MLKVNTVTLVHRNSLETVVNMTPMSCDQSQKVPSFYLTGWFPELCAVMSRVEGAAENARHVINSLNKHVLVRRVKKKVAWNAINCAVEHLILDYMLLKEQPELYAELKQACLLSFFKCPEWFLVIFYFKVEELLTFYHAFAINDPKQGFNSLHPKDLMKVLLKCYTLRSLKHQSPFSLISVPNECIEWAEERLFKADMQMLWSNHLSTTPSLVLQYYEQISDPSWRVVGDNEQLQSQSATEPPVNVRNERLDFFCFILKCWLRRHLCLANRMK